MIATGGQVTIGNSVTNGEGAFAGLGPFDP